MQKITTFLTFGDQAEEAVALYTSVFPGSRVVSERRYGPAGPGGDPDPEKAGRVMQAMLQMEKIEVAGLREAYEAG